MFVITEFVITEFHCTYMKKSLSCAASLVKITNHLFDSSSNCEASLFADFRVSKILTKPIFEIKIESKQNSVSVITKVSENN